MNNFPPKVIGCLVIAGLCLVGAIFAIVDSWRISRRK